jgi:sugar phosphate isomerase/epimerase
MSLLRTFSSLGCPELSLEQTFSLAEQHGIRIVELRALGSTIDLPLYFTELYGTPQKLADKLRGSDVSIAALATSFRLVGSTAAERERFLQYVYWAEALDVPWLRVFDGGRIAQSDYFTEAAETIHWWQALRRERAWSTDIMVETHDSLLTSAAILRFLDAIPGTAILWDSHHTWKRGAENPATTWTKIRPSVVHIHVKDSVSQSTGNHAYAYTLPGTGEFPAAQLFEMLHVDGFTGPVCLEWEKMWHPYLPSLDEALRAAESWDWRVSRMPT